ncbi:protein translocase subunit SecD [Cellulomonas sp. SLBN-39]|uniref:protein translocase subunit SecD n=1 Tax=Cellulomonas sp. SLBN-39 TaxID=2768446 RepID=UPI001170FEFA|nr:protein translocase subunit SecD [Cellulomonas sp. SLBN-39]TQL04242.1 preprotein translocase subunit SecD [Cellulomonas sp. SLBN-39]
MTLLLVVVAIFASIAAGTRWGDASFTPNLALDLEGGTQIILRPVPEAEGNVTEDTIAQAIDVIRQRVDASGVAEAEISSQGGQNIVVALPGTPSEETLELVRTSAQMELRPVLAVAAPTPVVTDESTEQPTDDATAAPEATEEAAAPADDATAEADPAATDEAATEDAAAEEELSDEPTKDAPDNASDLEYYLTPAVQAELDAFDCTLPENLTGGTPGAADEAVVTCDQTGTTKFLLGPVEIEGTDIASASSGLRQLASGGTSNEWVVNLEFTSAGTPKFTEVTTRLAAATAPLNQFAAVLDGLVISAPSVNEVIPNGQAEISGSFTQDSAAALANQLNFGSLPISFDVQSEQQISATLGSEQLRNGLIAGLIGLALVALYSLFQYRALGLVTIASLVVAAVVTYGVITLLSWTQGYRLSLPGVAGLIVAVGITADSFIVYFERIRDELRDGRTLPAAVERAWVRARRTIIASDAINFLAAVVLYFLAVGGVRGFAFTLGLTTVIDLLVVLLFTHPVMVLLAKTRFFGDGHPASGLDPRRLGVDSARYVGRGRVVAPGEKAARTGRRPEPVAAGTAGLTIAERRAAERAAQPPAPTDAPTTGRPEGSEH